jgi:hypothetical protein
VIGRELVGDEQTAAVQLLKKGIERHIESVADEIINIFGVEVGSTIVARKQRFHEAVHDCFKRITRGRPPDRTVLPDIVRGVARRPQLSDNTIKAPPRIGFCTFIARRLRPSTKRLIDSHPEPFGLCPVKQCRSCGRN